MYLLITSPLISLVSGEVLLFFCFLLSVLITPEFLFVPLTQGPLEAQVREIVSFPALLGDCELVI